MRLFPRIVVVVVAILPFAVGADAMVVVVIMTVMLTLYCTV